LNSVILAPGALGSTRLVKCRINSSSDDLRSKGAPLQESTSIIPQGKLLRLTSRTSLTPRCSISSVQKLLSGCWILANILTFIQPQFMLQSHTWIVFNPTRNFAHFNGKWLQLCHLLYLVSSCNKFVILAHSSPAKYNEMEEDVPDVYSFSGILGHDIPASVALDYELWVLKQMGWKLNARTPISFLHTYNCQGLVYPSDPFESGMQCSIETLKTILSKQYSLLCTLCTLDVRFKCYPASIVACAVVYVSRKRLGLAHPWRKELTACTGVVFDDFSEVALLLESASSSLLAQVAPAMAALTMTISPVKVNPRYAQQSNIFEARTPITKGDDGVSSVLSKLSLHHDVSPYTVAAALSPVDQPWTREMIDTREH
jgi:hypothetical protein